jgi:hypothetical protein
MKTKTVKSALTATATSAGQKPAARHDEAVSEQGFNVPGAVHSDPPAFRDNPAKFAEDILRQNAAPFHFDGWLHSGLND